MSYDLGDRPAPGADEADDLPVASASASGWGAASASSTGWRRARPRPASRSRRAFHRFYREHFGLVWSMVRRFGVSPAQHEDAVQEVWLVVHRRLHTLAPDASAKAWLSTIARRVASRLRRTEHRQHRKLAALHVTGERGRSVPPTRVDDHDARRLLDALFAALDDDQRDVLVLAQVHGLSGPEIAQALEIPLNTAYSRLRLARRRIDRFVAELGADEAAVIRELRRAEEPPPRAAAQAWVALLPQLGEASSGVGTAVSVGWLGGLAGVKTFAIAVAVGAAGLVTARTVVDARAAKGERAVVERAEASRAERSAAGALVQDERGREGEGSDSMLSSPAAAPVIDGRAEAGPVVASHGAALPAHEVSVSAREPAVEPTPTIRDASAPAPSSSAPASSPAALDAEAELIARAQQALRDHDPAAALRWLEEHERRFPAGELGDARRGARVRALCGLGRVAQARAEAHRLLRERPDSPVAAGVADVCS